MKKLLVVSLAVLVFYGCKSFSSNSETYSAKSHLWDYYTANLAESGLSASMLNAYCRDNLTTLTFNDTLYSKMEAYYANETNVKKLVMMQDPTNILEKLFGCDYNKEVCRGDDTEKRPDTYQVLTYNPDSHYSIEFKEFGTNPDLTTTLKEQIQEGTAKQLSYFAILKDTNEIQMNTPAGSGLFSKDKACEAYRMSLLQKYKKYSEDSTPVTVHPYDPEGVERNEGEPIEINGKKFRTLYYLINIFHNKEVGYTTWIGNSGELKGFGLKSQLSTNTCRTYKDTIVISQNKISNDEFEETTKENAKCKEFLYLFSKRYIKEYKFTPMAIHK